MREERQFYINGKWTNPIEGKDFPVIDPSTEEACATISLGGEADAEPEGTLGDAYLYQRVEVVGAPDARTPGGRRVGEAGPSPCGRHAEHRWASSASGIHAWPGA